MSRDLQTEPTVNLTVTDFDTEDPLYEGTFFDTQPDIPEKEVIPCKPDIL